MLLTRVCSLGECHFAFSLYFFLVQTYYSGKATDFDFGGFFYILKLI